MAITIQKKQESTTGSFSNTLRSASDFIKGIDHWLRVSKKVSSNDLNFFTYQLSMMLGTGIAINTSILTISNQIKNLYFKEVLVAVVQQVEKGKSLHEALRQYPNIFSNVYLSMVEAGEVSGNLKEMLDRVIAFQKKREGMFSALKSAMAYPVFLVVISTSVIVFILMVVFPKFGDIFGEIRDELPMTTRFLLSISDALTNYLLLILFIVAAIGIIAWKLLSSPKGRLFLDKLLFTIPLLKDFLIKFYVSQLMRTLGTLLGAGVVLMNAIKVSRGVVSHSLFVRFMDTLIKSIEEGRGIAQAIEKTYFFPQIVKQMIRTGEDTGNLPMAMNRIADYYDEELDRTMKILSTVLEPALLMIMGLVVGTVVISLILPIFQITKSLK